MHRSCPSKPHSNTYGLPEEVAHNLLPGSHNAYGTVVSTRLISVADYLNLSSCTDHYGLINESSIDHSFITLAHYHSALDLGMLKPVWSSTEVLLTPQV